MLRSRMESVFSGYIGYMRFANGIRTGITISAEHEHRQPC
jgi:hypothetical protein